MTTRLKYSLWAFIIFFISLIILFPANIAYRLWENVLAPVKLSLISGTIWHGRAGKLYLDGYPLDDFRWTNRPLSLLIGAFAVDVEITDTTLPLQGTVTTAIGGGLSGKDITGQLPAGLFASLVKVPSFGLQGDIQINLNEIEFIDQQVQLIRGKITLVNGSIQIPQKMQLGTIETELTTENDLITLKFKDKNAPIGVSGKLTTKPDRSYQFSAILKPGASADPGLLAILKNAGRPRSDGSIQFEFNGNY